MTQLNPYLSFAGNCKDAMKFYQEVFGGELEMQTIGESPIASQMPTTMQEHILHSKLEAGGFAIMGSDMIKEGEELVVGSVISLCLNFDTEEEINNHHAKLSQNAKDVQPLRKEFWGDIYGEIVDQFGIRWIMNCANKPA